MSYTVVIENVDEGTIDWQLGPFYTAGSAYDFRDAFVHETGWDGAFVTVSQVHNPEDSAFVEWRREQ